MKRLLLLLLSIMATASAMAQKGSTSTVSVTQKTLKQRSDMLDIDLVIESKNKAIKSGEWVTIIPILVRDEYRQELAPVLFYQRGRGQLLKRSKELSGYSDAQIAKSYAERVVKKKQGNMVNYNISLPAWGWMPGAHMEFTEIINTWAGKQVSKRIVVLDAIKQQELKSSSQDSTFLKMDTLYNQKDIYAETLEDVEQSAEFEIEKEQVQIDFRVGSSTIDLNYMSNLEQTVIIHKSINAVLRNPNAEIKRITLTGYASPDGGEVINEELANKRVLALKKDLQSTLDIDSSIVIVEWVGEDWQGLKKLVSYSQMPQAALVIDIIDNFPNVDQRKVMLREIDGGEVYDYMLTALFPMLRRVEYTIEYTNNN